MEASARQTQLLQPSAKVRGVPHEIRRGFVRKVYGITAAMLAVSFLIAAPFVFDAHSATDFVNSNPWIYALAITFLAVHHILNIAICVEACCGSGRCMEMYLRMFVSVPWNYMFCMTYSASFGVLLGAICAEYEAESVALVFLLTFVITVALTIYAAYTSTDFTGFGMYIFAAFVGLLLLGLVALFFPWGSLIDKAIAAFSAVICSFSIVYDTQLIVGTASLDLRSSATRKIEFTVDMYCFAAYQLYLDFINLFIDLLRLLGKRRD